MYKQAEIRVREEEIKVIEDIIRFVDEYQSKQATKLTSKSATRTTIDSPNRTIQQGFFFFSRKNIKI